MWIVFLKEINELFRDRKTIFFMIALPLLLFPLLFGAIGYFSTQAIQKVESEILDFAVINQQQAPELVAALAADEGLNHVINVDLTDPQALIDSDQAAFVLELPEDFGQPLLDKGEMVVKVYLNDAGVNMVRERLKQPLDEITQQLQQQAFAALQLSERQAQALLNPIELETINVANERETWGERVGGLIPYMLFILCLQGAMIPASDVGAGEKERGTLETLLITPIDRTHLVLGKFLVVAFAGMASALVTVASFALWGTIIGQGMAIELLIDVMSSIALYDFMLMFLVLIPVVAIFASILLCLSIYATSFKEAQGYMSPMVFVVILPLVVAMLPGITLDGVWSWVPLTNVALAIKELVKGTMNYVMLVPIFLSHALMAAVLISFSTYWFNQEKVLFR